MKYLTTIVAAFVCFLSSCTQAIPKEEDSQLEQYTENEIKKIGLNDVEVIILDGCEYIVYKEIEGINLGFGYMSHKGNCNNPIHCYNSPSDPKNTIGQIDSIIKQPDLK
tara:strand:+ start:223 stop:549 length:327 start_codon:yes stop_codon:yes gene_type:complete